MKTKYIKQLFSAALIAVLSSGVTSCINDLDISPIDPQTGSSFDQQGVFVKGYAMLGVTGQKGIDGSPDLDGQDEGESGFYRTTFNCNCLLYTSDAADERSAYRRMSLGMAGESGHPPAYKH